MEAQSYTASLLHFVCCFITMVNTSELQQEQAALSCKLLLAIPHTRALGGAGPLAGTDE